MSNKLKVVALFWFITSIIIVPIVICVLMGFAQAGYLKLINVEPEEDMFITYVWARSMLSWRATLVKDYARGYKLIWRV